MHKKYLISNKFVGIYYYCKSSLTCSVCDTKLMTGKPEEFLTRNARDSKLYSKLSNKFVTVFQSSLSQFQSLWYHLDKLDNLLPRTTLLAILTSLSYVLTCHCLIQSQ